MDKLLEIGTKELSRLEVMQRLSEERMSQKEAGEILHLRTRQIKRLLKAYRKLGATGLISGHRRWKGTTMCLNVQQAERLPQKPAPDHPRHRGAATAISKLGNALPQRDISTVGRADGSVHFVPHFVRKALRFA